MAEFRWHGPVNHIGAQDQNPQSVKLANLWRQRSGYSVATHVEHVQTVETASLIEMEYLQLRRPISEGTSPESSL